MPIPDNPLYWQVGADPRAVGSYTEKSFGRIRSNDLSIYGYLTLMRQWYNPSNLLNVPSNVRPYVVTNAYPEDDNQVAFPAGTVWICCQNTGEGYGPTTLRSLGAGGVKDVTFSYASPIPVWRGNMPVDVVYYASDIPKGASGTIVIYNGIDNTGTVVGTFSVDGTQGPNTTLTASALFTSVETAAKGGTSPTAYTVESTWAGGNPRFEAVSLLESGANALYFAVPSGSVPSGYVFNPDTGIQRGGSFGIRYQADPRRYTEVNAPIHHYGMPGNGAVCDAIVGLPVFSQLNALQSIWINDQCQNYTWLPIAVGTKTFTGGSATGGVEGIPPFEFFFNAGGPAITSLGARAGKLTITFVQGNIGATTLGPQPGDSAVISVLCNGSTVYTTTLSGTGIALSSPMIVTVPAMMPGGGPGSTCTIQVTMSVSGTIAVDGSGHQKLEQWTISATLSCSPRCDIPWPFTCGSGTDSSLVYPGAYLASALTGAPQNNQPITPVVGIFASVGTTPEALAFSPASDGWYRVINSSSAPQNGIGENPFGWATLVSLARGHAGVPFYCLGAASTGYTLTPFTPPLTSIVQSGSTLDLSAAPSGFGFGQITFPAAGNYVVTLSLQDATQALNGLIIRTSGVDPTLLHYDRALVWETLNEYAGTLFSSASVLNDPPFTPSNTAAVIVGSVPTGVFVGHAGHLALWDDIQGLYQFTIPTDAPFSSVALPYWRYGGIWRTVTDIAFNFIVPVTQAGQVLYLGLECFAPARAASGRVQIAWAPS